MKPALRYIELKSGYSDNGPAWIGFAEFSKSGQTIYFNGQAFRSIGGSGIAGNFVDVERVTNTGFLALKKTAKTGIGKVQVKLKLTERWWGYI
jgi:hypothetical protein